MAAFEKLQAGVNQALADLRELEQGPCGVLVWAKLRTIGEKLESALAESELLKGGV